MIIDSAIALPSGRTIGYAVFGSDDGPPVLWCHGGPGCRQTPAYVAGTAAGSAYRFIGIDRPGYGRSDPLPGRTIADWVGDALAVADHLGIDRFATVGTSTGGQYGLALAACAPERVGGVVAACSMTDIRYAPARATMSYPHAIAVWDAPDRDHALTAAIAAHGIDGTKIIDPAEGPSLAASDRAMLARPWGRLWIEALPEMFAHGLEGYTDDRLADNGGWTSFSVDAIRCPVTVLQGSADVIVRPIHARHTASIVPHAQLRMIEGAGHFSIEDHIAGALAALDPPPR